PGHGAVAESPADRDLLGDHRRARRGAPASFDAVADPRELPGPDAAPRVCARGGIGRDRRGRGAARRRFITTYLSWRIAFLGEVGITAIVLVGGRRAPWVR